MDNNESNFTQFDDVDDFHNSNLGLTVFNGQNTFADIGDYVDITLNINTQINYTEDRPDGNVLNPNTPINPVGGVSPVNNTSAVGGSSNIKFIRVNLTSGSGVDELDKNITFQAFSCNIGTYLPQGETDAP
jgi:hypothetical protein